jgi:hypothetical protein
MARMIGIAGSAALSSSAAETSKSVRRPSSLARRIMSLLRGAKDRDIERYIRQRGGVMTDDIDRELSRHFGRM